MPHHAPPTASRRPRKPKPKVGPGLSAVFALTVVLTASATSIDPVLDTMAMFGINRASGNLSRFNFDGEELHSIGTITDNAGNVYTGIDASAYIPGHQCLVTFWNDPSDSLSKMVYVDTETAKASVVGSDLGPGKVSGAVAAQSTGNVNLSGLININPNNSPDNEFILMTNTGTVFTRDDLHQNTNVNGDGVFYTGAAGYARVKPKGNGQQNGLLVNFETLILSNSQTLVITGELNVTVYNDHINSQGKAMGKWYIAFGPSEANLQTLGDGGTVEGAAKWSVYAVQKVEAEEDDDIDFNIVGDTVVPTEPFAAKVTILGAAITASGSYNIPVTVRVKAGGTTYEPFGNFYKPVNATVNDNNNPRHYVLPNIYPAGTSVSVIGRSWIKKKSWYSGSKNSHWQSYMTVDGSNSDTQQLIVLRNGDDVPDIDGFMEQNNLVDFIQDYIDTETNTIVLDENQAIFLYELGTTNMSSSAADFQDLVALVTLAADPDDLVENDDDDDTAGDAARLVKVNHKTGGYAQIMTLDRVYDSLATKDGNVFYATHGNQLYKLTVADQTELLVGTVGGNEMFGLEFAGDTLMGFEIVGDRLHAMDALTGAAIGTPATLGMYDLGTITFMPMASDPSLQPKSFD